MKRGDIFICADKGGDYTGSPRPVVIIQATDCIAERDSVTICPLTTELIDAPTFRIRLNPSEGNGIKKTSDVMADKVSTVRKSRLTDKIGKISEAGMVKLGDAIRAWLFL